MDSWEQFKQRTRKKDKKNKKSSLTMMVIPHVHGKSVRSFCLPMWLVRSFLALSLTCILIVGYFVSGFFYLRYVAEENKELREVNIAQEKEITQLKGLAGDMKGKLEALIKLDQEVRAKVGLSKPGVEKVEAKVLKSSRTEERYQFITMGLASPGNGQPVLTSNQALIPYQQSEAVPLDNNKPVHETQNEDIVMEQPYLEGDINTLDDLKEQLAQLDSVLTEQMDNISKLKTDVEKQLAYQAALPTYWPYDGRITSTFGWRRNPYTKKGNEFHDGIDIAGPYGSPIRAAGDGVVLFSGWKSSWGRIVIISHGYGYVSQYAHNSSLLVKAGDKVERGQVIARMGNTGRSTGTHVHFGVAQNGQWINPYKLKQQ